VRGCRGSGGIATLVAATISRPEPVVGCDDLPIVSRNPYYKNVGKRLTKWAKVYLHDSGILHQLLNIQDLDTLQGHPSRGMSSAGFVIEQIVAMLPDWEPYFYRTPNGAEFDLLMVKGAQILAFEIKASVPAKLSKG